MNRPTETRYKNVIFDLDGTLVHKRPSLPGLIQKYFERNGVIFTEHQIKSTGVWSHKFWEDPENYYKDPVEKKGRNNSFWPNYLEFYGELLNIPSQVLENIGADLETILNKQGREEYILEGTRDVLSTLLKYGFRLGVLSNRYTKITAVIEHFQLFEFFPVTLTAGELGEIKPNKQIFYKFLEEFGGFPDDSVYIGDNYWLDVQGARNAGITPILFDPNNWYTEVDCLVVRDLADIVPYLLSDTI